MTMEIPKQVVCLGTMSDYMSESGVSMLGESCKFPQSVAPNTPVIQKIRPKSDRSKREMINARSLR